MLSFLSQHLAGLVLGFVIGVFAGFVLVARYKRKLLRTRPREVLPLNELAYLEGALQGKLLKTAWNLPEECIREIRRFVGGGTLKRVKTLRYNATSGNLEERLFTDTLWDGSVGASPEVLEITTASGKNPLLLLSCEAWNLMGGLLLWKSEENWEKLYLSTWGDNSDVAIRLLDPSCRGAVTATLEFLRFHGSSSYEQVCEAVGRRLSLEITRSKDPEVTMVAAPLQHAIGLAMPAILDNLGWKAALSEVVNLLKSTGKFPTDALFAAEVEAPVAEASAVKS